MKRSLQTVTVVIPAYNEGSQITALLREVLRQTFTGATLSAVLVYSDGSTDNTVNAAERVRDPRVTVLVGQKQLGRAARQTEMLRLCTTDIVILLDADIVLTKSDTLNRLIAPVRDGQADLTAAAIAHVPPKTWVEHALAASMEVKQLIFATWKQGVHVYACTGPARAMARSFYRDIRFPHSAGEDMYTYFSCLARGLRFVPVTGTLVYYRLPGTVADYFKQSKRFRCAPICLYEEFGEAVVKREFAVPLFHYAATFVRTFPVCWKKSLWLMAYLLLLLGSRISHVSRPAGTDTWQARSTKLVRSGGVT